MLSHTAELLRRLFGTTNQATFAVSGTGFSGMEAALVNILEPGDTIITGISGFFGTKANEICQRLGAETVTVSSGFGRPVETDEIAAALTRNPSTKAVFLVAAETSVGLRQPLAEIASLCHEHGALLIADMVTLLGGAVVKTDEWGIDVAYGGSQNASARRGSRPDDLFPTAPWPRSARVGCRSPPGTCRRLIWRHTGPGQWPTITPVRRRS